MPNFDNNDRLTNQKPFILAAETSGRRGSAAIASGRQLLAEKHFSAPMTHSAEAFPTIQNLLKQFNRNPKDIEQIYISVGPGSFTGLRIAVTMAKTMHLANDTKIIAVDTLDVIAANVIDLTTQYSTQKPVDKLPHTEYKTIASILDAKRGQFFVAVYNRQVSNNKNEDNQSEEIWEKILPDCLMTPSQFLTRFSDTNHPVWLLGEGLVYHKDKFKADGIRFFDENFWNPRAGNVHLLGWEMAQAGKFADPLTLQPNYLRRPEAEDKYQETSSKSQINSNRN